MSAPVSSEDTLPPPPLVPGDLVDGKYRVQSELGSGAMGVVMLARHEALDIDVALKVVTAHGLEATEAAQRFLREARVAAKLESEHVVRVSDLGRLPSGAPYMVMELLRGVDLAEHLVRCGPMAPAEAVDAVLEVLEPLAEAHAMGIVHRDLKPSNLFRAERSAGTVMKVLDFGISKAADAAGVSLTNTHTMMGSPSYMSPEQILATKEVDARADLWSMGVVLYELLAGAPPFEGVQMGALLTQVLSAPIPPLSSRVPGLPEGLEAVVHRCLDRDLGKRTASAADLAEALAPYASSAGALVAPRILRHAGGTGTVRAPELTPKRKPVSLQKTLQDFDPDGARATLVAAPTSGAMLAARPTPTTEPSAVAPPRPVAGDVPHVEEATPVAPRSSGVAPWMVGVLLAAALVAGWFAHGLR